MQYFDLSSLFPITAKDILSLIALIISSRALRLGHSNTRKADDKADDDADLKSIEDLYKSIDPHLTCPMTREGWVAIGDAVELIEQIAVDLRTSWAKRRYARMHDTARVLHYGKIFGLPAMAYITGEYNPLDDRLEPPPEIQEAWDDRFNGNICPIADDSLMWFLYEHLKYPNDEGLRNYSTRYQTLKENPSVFRRVWARHTMMMRATRAKYGKVSSHPGGFAAANGYSIVHMLTRDKTKDYHEVMWSQQQ